MTFPSSPETRQSRPQRKDDNFWFYVALVSGSYCLILYCYVFGPS